MAQNAPIGSATKVVHLQREWYGAGAALCGAPADPANVPIDLAIANPGALVDRALCSKCVTRFHRIKKA